MSSNLTSSAMRVLAIETSCDETAISIVECFGGINPPIGEPRFKILSNIIASQIKIHAKWGGVVPNLAKREHIKNLPIVLKKALRKTKMEDIDLIAVTVGPGLEPALWTGINFAEDLAKKSNKPLIGINHMEGHIVASLLNQKNKITFPAIALLVSGGHTEIVFIRKWLDYKIIGQTRDDAAGEAFDKVAKMLKLPYPGGPEISKMAEKFKIKNLKLKINLPRPMINSKDYDFSFSGLKTAVLYLIKDLQKTIPKFSDRKDLVSSICHEFQQAVIDVLIKKTICAAKEYKIKTLILGGGVSANTELRKQLAEAIKKELPNTLYLIPDIKYTTDNAVMIAIAACLRRQAYFHALKKPFDKLKVKSKKLKANGNLILK
ncbi:tRNA (adenosine(37)-N6)-threonylcarbamoyltransferase complex transferase subunit TsaD [Patescibacteria group bacterium]|nr:tRNA (adenosine(37)-N6)-threonylcarbamoyltransferase complex transferase subunit TsaD [Patescibacteria group bacterium]